MISEFWLALFQAYIYFICTYSNFDRFYPLFFPLSLHLNVFGVGIFFLVSRVFLLFVITHIHCYIWNKLIDSILTFLSPLWFIFVFQTNVEGGRCFVLNFEVGTMTERKILPMEIFIRISDRFDSLFTANILFTVYFRCYTLHKYSQYVIYMYQRRHTPKKKQKKHCNGFEIEQQASKAQWIFYLL